MTRLNKLVTLALFAALSVPALAITDEQVFRWAVAQYPQYFRGTPVTGTFELYDYRYYPDTGNYLGVDLLGNVHAIGASFGTFERGLRVFGTAQGLSDQINVWESQQTAYVAYGTVTLAGTVTDKQGLPIAGATISLFHHNVNQTEKTVTDANGFYSFNNVDKTNNSRYTADYSLYAEKAGLAIYPAAGDGKLTRMDFNGIYRAVLRYFPVPVYGSYSSNFIASRAGDKLTSLPRSGQTKVAALGDDASAAKGVAWPYQRFTDNKDGTVSDHLTGLIWLKNAGCLGASGWNAALIAANRLASGACGLSDGSVAGQWHMPNVNELESLVDVSQSNPSLPLNSPFKGVANSYWSSTTYTAASSNAFVIRFTDGRWINGTDGDYNDMKDYSVNAGWAVRTGGEGAVKVLATGVYSGIGGRSYGAGDDASLMLGVPLTSHQRFVDNNDGTLVDTVTGLTWVKKADCIKQSWSAALGTIDALADGQCGLSDGSKAGQWRMPNRNELLSLADRAPSFPLANYFASIPGADGITTVAPEIFHNFKVSVYYWTSSTDAADPTHAWGIYSCDFGVYDILKTDAEQYALAVR